MATKPHILVLNGPNLNMLGQREPAVYGTDTLADIERRCHAHANAIELTVDFRQSNHEGELVGWIQDACGTIDGLIINAGAYTHTSVALLDALTLLECPIIELHLSNIFAREDFRHHSFISSVAKGVICGLGARGYTLALDAAKSLVDD